MAVDLGDKLLLNFLQPFDCALKVVVDISSEIFEPLDELLGIRNELDWYCLS